jgi:hypothetical protein
VLLDALVQQLAGRQVHPSPRSLASFLANFLAIMVQLGRAQAQGQAGDHGRALLGQGLGRSRAGGSRLHSWAASGSVRSAFQVCSSSR